MSPKPAASRLSITHGEVSDSATVNQIEPVHAPCAPSAIAAAICRPRPIPPSAAPETAVITRATLIRAQPLPEPGERWLRSADLPAGADRAIAVTKHAPKTVAQASRHDAADRPRRG